MDSSKVCFDSGFTATSTSDSAYTFGRPLRKDRHHTHHALQ
ncbi:hypothetical protein HU200_008011 [Digitaria exilis]|uniref:Uncharacterized protein n=1 Tax=Digitaria exilis TaxID=1010633 RepID=A0A835FLJ3_9POAL|nr:hypothetical protein HU200_008011 [Digitaria exilis]